MWLISQFLKNGLYFLRQFEVDFLFLANKSLADTWWGCPILLSVLSLCQEASLRSLQAGWWRGLAVTTWATETKDGLESCVQDPRCPPTSEKDENPKSLPKFPGSYCLRAIPSFSGSGGADPVEGYHQIGSWTASFPLEFTGQPVLSGAHMVQAMTSPGLVKHTDPKVK